MQITRLLMVHSGTYNDIALRPYTTHVDQQSLDLFREATDNGTMFEPASLSMVAGNILRPSTQAVGGVSIANGWDTRRFRFIMEVVHEERASAFGRQIQYVAGYTDHSDISYQGTIDPNMRLFINTSIMVREVMEDTPMGRVVRRNLADASHILSGSYRADPSMLSQQPQTMRPEDVFRSIGTSVLGDSGEIFDFSTSFAGGPKKSRVNNSSAPTYLSRVMNSYSTAMQAGEYDDDLPKLMRKARADSQEGLVASDPFLSNLNRNTSFSEGTSVTYGELCQLSPGLDEQVLVSSKDDPIQTSFHDQHQRGSTSYWVGMDNETIFATMIAQSLPAIMMDAMLTEAAIGFTNRTMDGQFHLEFLAEPMSFIADSQLTSQLAQPFLRRFETEVLRELTQNNLIDISGHVYCDVTGETRIQIAVSGGPATDYVAPAFCDALSAPVITNNSDNLRDLSNDLSHLVDNVSQDNRPMAGTEMMPSAAAWSDIPSSEPMAFEQNTPPKSFFS